MTDSILDSTKKVLGVATSNEDFDVDILMHINSTLSVLTQVGIGPEEGIFVEDSSATWDAFIGSDNRMNMAKSYVYAKVRLLFDTSSLTSYVIQSLKETAQEFEWRLNVIYEGDTWTPPAV